MHQSGLQWPKGKGIGRVDNDKNNLDDKGILMVDNADDDKNGMNDKGISMDGNIDIDANDLDEIGIFTG